MLKSDLEYDMRFLQLSDWKEINIWEEKKKGKRKRQIWSAFCVVELLRNIHNPERTQGPRRY